MSDAVFRLSYAICFCVGGVLNFLGILPIRLAYVSFLPFLLIPKHGLRFDAVLAALLGFAAIVVVSGIVNTSSVSDILLFLRYAITPFGMYYLVEVALRPTTVRKVLTFSVGLSLVQLPVVVIQRVFYDDIIPFTSLEISNNDIGFGTFFTSNDPAMAFFLAGIILFLLFDNRNNTFIKRRLSIAFVLSLTILISGAQLMHLVVFLIWGFYMLSHLNIKTLAVVGAFAVLAVGSLQWLGFMESFGEKLDNTIEQITFEGDAQEAEDAFLSGNYSRGAALLYYLDQPMKIIGDGPSRYYSPVTREYVLGNTGQLLTFYSEVGMAGLLAGYIVLFVLASRHNGISSVYKAFLFFVVSIITITTGVMNDSSIMLTYAMLLRTDLISTPA